MVGLEETDKPEEDVDVEEEEDIGEEKGVVIAPRPKRGEGIIGISG